MTLPSSLLQEVLKSYRLQQIGLTQQQKLKIYSQFKSVKNTSVKPHKKMNQNSHNTTTTIIKIKNPSLQPQDQDTAKLEAQLKQNPMLFAIMKGMQTDENVLKKNLKQMQLFLMVFWMLNFVIAFQDRSPIMEQLGFGIVFTFKTWNIVDGSISLFLLPMFLIVSATIDKHKIKKISLFIEEHPKKSVIVGILAALKISWVCVGLYFFSRYNFAQTSNTLMQFSLTYFVGFIGGCVYSAQYYFRKKTNVDAFDEYAKKMGISNISETIDKLMDKLDRQQQGLAAQLKKQSVVQFTQDQAMVIPFVMILNLIFAVKDTSACMDYTLLNLALTFRQWHIVQGILLVATTILTNMITYSMGRLVLGLDLCCKPIFVIALCLTCLMAGTLMAWLIVGMVVYFGVTAEVECSDDLQGFSVTYFMFMLMMYAIVLFDKIKECIKSCV